MCDICKKAYERRWKEENKRLAAWLRENLTPIEPWKCQPLSEVADQLSKRGNR